MTEIEFATRAFIATLPHGERERAAKLFLANATEGFNAGFNAGFTTAQLNAEAEKIGSLRAETAKRAPMEDKT